MSIVTYQDRWLPSIAGGQILVKRVAFRDEPSTLVTAAANMMQLAGETGLTLDTVEQAMKLLHP